MKFYLIYNKTSGQIWRCLNDFKILENGSIQGEVNGVANLNYPKTNNAALLRISEKVYNQINNNYHLYKIIDNKLIRKK